MNFYVMVYNYGEYDGYSMPLYVWRAEKLIHHDVWKGLITVYHGLVNGIDIEKLIRDKRFEYLEIHELAEV